MKNHQLLIAAPLLALLAACAGQPAANPVTLTDTIAHNPELSTLSALVAQSGLAETLKAAGPYTVFAPTNEAFKAVPPKTMDELAHDPERLKAILSYHVVMGKMMAAEVKNSQAKTAQGTSLSLGKAGEIVTVEDAMVQSADIIATNGVVHTVDRVLMPPLR